jgi:hypothetical protein
MEITFKPFFQQAFSMENSIMKVFNEEEKKPTYLECKLGLF